MWKFQIIIKKKKSLVMFSVLKAVRKIEFLYSFFYLFLELSFCIVFCCLKHSDSHRLTLTPFSLISNESMNGAADLPEGL